MLSELRTEFRGHFDRLAEGKLAFPVCEECDRMHWYPMPICPHCQSKRVSWHSVGGQGEVWSWTIVRHPFDQGYRDKLPYVVAMICFRDAPGVRLIANIVDVSPEQLRVGLPVEFVPSTGGEKLPRPLFRPLRTEA